MTKKKIEWLLIVFILILTGCGSAETNSAVSDGGNEYYTAKTEQIDNSGKMIALKELGPARNTLEMEDFPDSNVDPSNIKLPYLKTKLIDSWQNVGKLDIEEKKYGYVISVISNELTDAISKAVTNPELTSESLSELTEAMRSVSTAVNKTGADFCGKEFHNHLLILNSSNTDRVLLHIVDGEVAYDICEDYQYKGMTVSADDNTETSTVQSHDKQDSKSDSNSHSGTSSASTTSGQRNALEKAQQYLSFTAFSHDGLVEQLEYEGYSHSDSQWAADHCGADWKEQALRKAGEYLDYSAFSYSGLVDQLEYEGFTSSEAEYGVDHCGADWNEQAVKKAKEYLRYSSFSRSELIDQLEYEGFTYSQAEYGVAEAY